MTPHHVALCRRPVLLTLALLAAGAGLSLVGCAECESGEACMALGRQRLEVAPAERDPEGAARAFERSCALEHGPGCTSLARMHHMGLGLERDPGAAAEAYERACALSDAEGCAGLAELLEVGQGVRADPARAAALRARACAGGMHAACASPPAPSPASAPGDATTP